MRKAVRSFLKRHWDGTSPLLLGYSGGPDSKALLYALREEGVQLLLAHVDHGWREESAEEARDLEEEARGLKIPFYLKRVKVEGEDGARRERRRFFGEVMKGSPAQALLLAHNKGDQIETVLKRVCEGAHLAQLKGMGEVDRWEGGVIFRPLLSVERKEVEEFLKEQNLTPLYDRTNFDLSYVRNRLRYETLPALERGVGKCVGENFYQLSLRSKELFEYLNKRVAGVVVERSPWGLSVDAKGLEKIEVRHLIQRLALEEGLTLPRTLLEPLVDGIVAGNKKLEFSYRGRKLGVVGTCFSLAAKVGETI